MTKKPTKPRKPTEPKEVNTVTREYYPDHGELLSEICKKLEGKQNVRWQEHCDCSWFSYEIEAVNQMYETQLATYQRALKRYADKLSKYEADLQAWKLARKKELQKELEEL